MVSRYDDGMSISSDDETESNARARANSTPTVVSTAASLPPLVQATVVKQVGEGRSLPLSKFVPPPIRQDDESSVWSSDLEENCGTAAHGVSEQQHHPDPQVETPASANSTATEQPPLYELPKTPLQLHDEELAIQLEHAKDIIRQSSKAFFGQQQREVYIAELSKLREIAKQGRLEYWQQHDQANLAKEDYNSVIAVHISLLTVQLIDDLDKCHPGNEAKIIIEYQNKCQNELAQYQPERSTLVDVIIAMTSTLAGFVIGAAVASVIASAAILSTPGLIGAVVGGVLLGGAGYFISNYSQRNSCCFFASPEKPASIKGAEEIVMKMTEARI